jgi:hypothetical protein
MTIFLATITIVLATTVVVLLARKKWQLDFARHALA